MKKKKNQWLPGFKHGKGADSRRCKGDILRVDGGVLYFDQAWLHHCMCLSQQKCMLNRVNFVVVIQSLSYVQLFATPWTVASQAPLSMGFPRQEDCRWLPFLSPGYLPHPGVKPMSPALAAGFFTAEAPGKPQGTFYSV